MYNLYDHNNDDVDHLLIGGHQLGLRLIQLRLHRLIRLESQSELVPLLFESLALLLQGLDLRQQSLKECDRLKEESSSARFGNLLHKSLQGSLGVEVNEKFLLCHFENFIGTFDNDSNIENDFNLETIEKCQYIGFH